MFITFFFLLLLIFFPFIFSSFSPIFFFILSLFLFPRAYLLTLLNTFTIEDKSYLWNFVVPCFSTACIFLCCIYLLCDWNACPEHKLRLRYNCRTEDVEQNGLLILWLKKHALIVCRLFKIISSLQSSYYKTSAGLFKVLITSANKH